MGAHAGSDWMEMHTWTRRRAETERKYGEDLVPNKILEYLLSEASLQRAADG